MGKMEKNRKEKDRRKKYNITIILLSLIGVFFVIFTIYKCFIAGHSMPIFGPNAISQYRTVNLGGVDQSILIRGVSKSNPVLLYIHGGPGSPETSFIVPYQKEWERYFTVVNWDQRGSGRSYREDIDLDTLTTNQICSDAIELTKYLKEEFQVDKIYIVAHSYGSYIGMKCIQMNSNNYYAYVGIGQVGNQQENEKKLIDYATKMAVKYNNSEAISELSALGDFPYNKKDFGSKISLSRKWTRFYGGLLYGKKSANLFTVESIIRPEYNLFDLIAFIKGANLYSSNTDKDQARWELFNADLPKEVPCVKVPVYFIQGRDDYTTSFQECEEYYNKLQAPYKELIPIEKCAHNPIVEHSNQVSNLLINKVLTNENE